MSGLYSPINRAAESITRPKGTGAEYMAELQKKPGYKPAEADDRDLQTLMALPQMERAAFMEKLKAQANKFPLKHRELGQGQTHHESYTLPGGENYREILLHTPMPEGQGFPGVPHHFGGTPNILASIRVKDRTTPEGKKMLHLEEIQSDWHQQGREKGYDTKIKEPSAQEREEWRVLDNIHPNNRTQEQYARLNYLDHLMAKEPFGVPHGPHSKDWHELALKAMIQHAAENGYDQIGITPGAEQAKRFSLSKQVGSVSYNPETQHFQAFKPNRETIANEKGVTPERIQALIGKEATAKLLQAPQTMGHHYLEGEGLDIGGEGMKGFYDRMVPSFLNKFGKKHGVQVQRGEINADNPYGHSQVAMLRESGIPEHRWGDIPYAEKERMMQAYSAKQPPMMAPVHTFDITPSMREDILKNGIPRYADGGTVDPMGNYSDATDSPITDDLTAKPVAVSIPARIQAYRPDPTGKYGGKDGLETLPTEFRTNTLMDYAKAAGLASSMGYKQPTPDQLTNLALQEGARSDFGHNRSLSYDHPDVAKLISEGIAPDSAAFAILAHQKMQTANRLKIPFERAWNGTGRSEFGKTGKDYANSIAAGSYAANHPKNKQLADLIRQSYDSGKAMNNFDPGQGNDWATGGIIHKAEGGSMNLTTQQMRAALMHGPNITSLSNLQSIGAQEAPSLPVKEFIAPHGAPTYGSIPVGGIDENLQQPGQQMSPQQPQQQGQQPQGGAQPPQGGGAPPQGPESNILSLTPQGQAMAAMRPTGMASGGSMGGSDSNEKRVTIHAEGSGGVKGLVVPRHTLEGNEKSGAIGLHEMNEARSRVYGAEPREPLTLNKMASSHKKTLESHFQRPLEEQHAAETEALERLRSAKHLGKTANTLDESEKLDTVRHEHDEQGRTHIGFASKGVAGHALYTTGHGKNTQYRVVNTCPGQTEGCGGGKDANGIVDTKKGTCFAPNAESQYPAAAARRAAHEQAKHDPAMTNDWILAHTGSLRKAARLADRNNQRLLFRPNVVDETDVSSRHVIRHLNQQRKAEGKPPIIANSYGKTNELHDPENGYYVTHSNVGPKVKKGQEISENIGRDKARVRNTIMAADNRGDFTNEQGNKTPPKGSYMVTDVKRGSPMAHSMEGAITHAKYWSTGREPSELTEAEKQEGPEGHFGANGKPTAEELAHYGHRTHEGLRYDYQRQHILHPRLVNVPERKKNKVTKKMETVDHMIPTDSRFKDEEFLPKQRFMTKNGKKAGHILMTTPTESTSNIGHQTSFTHHVSPAHIEHAKNNNGEYEIDRPEDQAKAKGKEYVTPQAIKFYADGGSINVRHHGLSDDDFHAFPEQNGAAQRHLAMRHGDDEPTNSYDSRRKSKVAIHKDMDAMRLALVMKKAK